MGTVPDWITAIATVVAVVFAALAARSAGHQLVILRREAASRAREVRLAQARLVYWDEGSETKGYGFRLVNSSNEPVMGVTVHLTDPERTQIIAWGGLRPTGPEGIKIDLVADLMNGISREWSGKASPSDPAMFYGPHAFKIDLTFKDVGGHEWHRTADMSLTEIVPGTVLKLGPLDNYVGRRGQVPVREAEQRA